MGSGPLDQSGAAGGRFDQSGARWEGHGRITTYLLMEPEAHRGVYRLLGMEGLNRWMEAFNRWIEGLNRWRKPLPGGASLQHVDGWLQQVNLVINWWFQSSKVK